MGQCAPCGPMTAKHVLCQSFVQLADPKVIGSSLTLYSCRSTTPTVILDCHHHKPQHLITMSSPKRISPDSTKTTMLLQLKKQRVNYASSMIDAKIPEVDSFCLTRDRHRIKHIRQTGQLPTIQWQTVQKEYEHSLHQLLHRPVSIMFIDISKTTEKGSPVKVIDNVDLDQVMKEQSAAGCVVHGEHLVYIATFSTDVCKEILEKAQSATGLSYSISDDAVDGIKLVANGDTMQADEEAVYTANFGLTCRPQKPTVDSSNP